MSKPAEFQVFLARGLHLEKTSKVVNVLYLEVLFNLLMLCYAFFFSFNVHVIVTSHFFFYVILPT